MSVKALDELQPPLLLSRLSISWVHESHQDKQRRSTVQSYISKGEVKTLAAAEETLGWRECGVWNVAPLRFKSLSQLFLSFSASGKKKRKTCSHVVESHTAFISWRLWPTSHWFFQQKKSVSFTFPLGQMGQVKYVLFCFLAKRCCFCCKWRKRAHSLSVHTRLRRSCVEKRLCLFTPSGHQKVYMLMLYFKAAYSLLAEMKWVPTNINQINTFLRFFLVL